MEMLKVADDRLTTPSGRPVALRGVGLGGWMMMENFLNGFPGTEHQARDALRRSMGSGRADRLFDRILDEFFTDADAAFIAGLGLNCVRIAVNYRHLSDDANPFKIRQDGLRRLTDAVDACARHGIYTVIDLHAAPGFQNQSEHSDNPSHHAWLWRHRHFQDRLVAIWEALADRFRSRPEVAGYNLLNEPGDPTGEVIGPFYRRLVDAVRAVDPDHVIFLDGNRYANDFDVIGSSFDNTVYSVHDYALAGIRDAKTYPGEVRGQYIDRSYLEERFLERTAHSRKTGTPIWVGEFGPVYSADPAVDKHRYAVLRDQLEIYREHGASWSIWTYKDTHLSGLVSLDPDSPWSRLLQPIREKKERLGTEPWSTGEEGIGHVLAPLDELLTGDPTMLSMARKFAAWFGYNLVREPDGSGWFTNVAASARTSARAHDDVMHEPDRTHLGSLFVPEAPALAGFFTAREDRAATRAAWAADPTPVPALNRGNTSPRIIAHVPYGEAFPTRAEKKAAISDLPYLRQDNFVELRRDGGQDFLFIRRPNLYLGTFFGRRATSLVRAGLTFLWHPDAGMVVYSLNGDVGCWATELADGRLTNFISHP